MPDAEATAPFLADRQCRPWTPSSPPPAGITPVALYLPDEPVQLEVVYATAATRPKVADLRKLWADRWAKRPSAVLLVVAWPSAAGRTSSSSATAASISR